MKTQVKRTIGTLAFVLAATGPAWAFEPANPACIAPSGAGGGWDFTCRQVGKVLQEEGRIGATM